MDIDGQALAGLLEWKLRTRDLKERIMAQEFREMEDVVTYYSIMQNACTQLAGFVAVSSMMPGYFREWKLFVILCVLFAFLLYIVHPLVLGRKKMQALKLSSHSHEVICERKRIYRSCARLMREYNDKCVVAFPFRDAEYLLFREVGDVEMEKIRNFEKENADFIYQTKYYQKCLLLVSIGGLVYLVAFISAFYVFFQDVPKVSPGISYQAK